MDKKEISVSINELDDNLPCCRPLNDQAAKDGEKCTIKNVKKNNKVNTNTNKNNKKKCCEKSIKEIKQNENSTSALCFLAVFTIVLKAIFRNA